MKRWNEPEHDDCRTVRRTRCTLQIFCQSLLIFFLISFIRAHVAGGSVSSVLKTLCFYIQKWVKVYGQEYIDSEMLDCGFVGVYAVITSNTVFGSSKSLMCLGIKQYKELEVFCSYFWKLYKEIYFIKWITYQEYSDESGVIRWIFPRVQLFKKSIYFCFWCPFT